MTGNQCIRDFQHAYDEMSGWCWRCGKTRADGRRVGGLTERWPAVDYTEPRRGRDE